VTARPLRRRWLPVQFRVMTTTPQRDAPLELQDVYRASTTRGYIAKTWERRRYVWYVATGELRARQMNSALGNLWHLLNPALQIAVFFLIFGVVLDTDRGIDNFMLFLTVGVLMFQFGQKATMEGAKSIVANGGLMRSISFPRAVLPITSTTTEVLATIPAVGVMLVVAVATGETPSLTWFVLVPILALFSLFNLGASFVAARAASHVRDVEQILPFLFRLVFYASGIIFKAESYDPNNQYQWVFIINPYYCFITLGRWSIMAGNLQTDLLISAAVWSIVALCGGFAWFRRAEGAYARD
jgi:teichoic acid transport system permease protein